MRRIALVGISLALNLSAQLTVTRPSLGFLPEPAGGAIRPVLGVRGFPGLGAPVTLLEGAGRVLLSPQSDFALVEIGEQWRIVTLHAPESGPPRELPLSGGHVRLAALSPGGRTAVFLLDSGRVQVMEGLPSAPRAGLAGQVGTEAIAVAVNDGGDIVLAGFGGQPGSVAALRGGGIETVLQADAPAAIAFFPNASTAIVADRGRNEILSLDLKTSGAAVRVLASAGAGVSGPVDLAIDEPSGRVLVLNAGNRSILALSPDGGGKLLGCSFEPARIEPLGGKHLYAVSSANGESRWVIRLDSDEPLLTYMPSLD